MQSKIKNSAGNCNLYPKSQHHSPTSSLIYTQRNAGDSNTNSSLMMMPNDYSNLKNSPLTTKLSKGKLLS